MQAPEMPRCHAYMDGQWFLRTSKFMFDAQLPSFNPKKLADVICKQNKWVLNDTRFYVDIPVPEEAPWWSNLWAMRIEDMEAQGIKCWHAPQRVRQAMCVESSPRKTMIRSDIEITMKMSLDVLADVLQDKVDVVILFTKENKYITLVDKLKAWSREHDKYIKIVTSYPCAEDRGRNSHSGIDKTDWFPIRKSVFDASTDFLRMPQIKEPAQIPSAEQATDVAT